MRWESEQQARNEIRSLVSEYYEGFHKKSDKPFKPGDRISYAGRVYDENEMCSLTDAMLDFWLTSGRFSDEFEKKFSEFLGIKYACLVNSGSSANLLAFMALTSNELGDRRIKPGDEVITVACGFPTTITPILQYGAVPVFVDITIPQYNVDADMLEEALSKKTKAVFLAHTLGNPFDIGRVKQFCDKNNLWLIEDNCDALGSAYTFDGKTKYTGTWGDIGTSSFYPPHHITLGEGGCVYTDNPLLFKLVKSFRDWGRECSCASGQDNLCGHRFDGKFGALPYGYDHKYVYSHMGYNLKATDLQASIGVEQMKKLPGFIRIRKENWNYLHNNLMQLRDKLILPEKEENSDPSWFGFLVTVKDDCKHERNEITSFLEERKIQTRLLFSGNYIKHPCFEGIRGEDKYRIVSELKNTDDVMNRSFWLGVYPGMTKEMLDYMIEQLIEVLR